ncbi:DUF2141 domain-containing protein [Myxococcota bacterium]|nr:DUF2141 domain-containing protein [Myxococcota bacterium]
MKSLLQTLTTLIAVLSFSTVAYAADEAASETTWSLTVKVDSLRNSEGVVQFSIYNKDDNFPEKKYEHFFKQKVGTIKNGKSTVTFENLPTGRYAVNILHDEDKDGKIKKGFLLPIEGVGFTNYETINLMNRPNFTDASFELKANTTKSVKIIYM